MSSLQQIFLLALLSLSSLHLSSATPILAGRGAYATPALPAAGEATNLPNPLPNLSLKHITIGSGIQNYTCKAGSSKPTSIGALATLYDATALAYSLLSSPSTLHSIPGHTVHSSLSSILIAGSPLSLSGSQAPSGGSSLPIIGSHYFSSAGTPVFDLVNVREIFFGKKIADVPAPKGAVKGSDGCSAVDWLTLADDGSGRSVGIAEVYRVETAGGSPPARCDGWAVGEVISVQYSAEYWFYG